MRERRLAELYDRWATNVHAYAVRHCGLEGADDIVSETFVVVWRRIDVVPEDALPWLLVVARNTIAHHRRSAGRRTRLDDALAARFTDQQPSTEEIATARMETLQALGQLSAKEREALLLIAWDGLTVTAAAEVAGCRERAFRARLTRARAHLRSTLQPVASTHRHVQSFEEPAS